MKRLLLGMERELLVADLDDGGRVGTTSHLKGMQPTCIAQDPFQPERLYCGTFGRGLWCSDDFGDSWYPVGDGCDYFEPLKEKGILYEKITAVAVSPHQKGNGYGGVYVGTEPSALFSSEDGGQTWREHKEMKFVPSHRTWSFPPRPHTHHVRWITPDPEQSERIYVSIEFGAVLRSLDGGKTWEDKKFQGPLDAHTLLVHPSQPDRLYAACGDGLFREGCGYMESRDGGQSWIPLGQDLKHPYLYGMAVDAKNPDWVLVSASIHPNQAHHARMEQASSTIYRKEGDRWLESVDGLPGPEGMLISALANDPSESGVFYALNNLGLFRSVDVGKTWEKINLGWKEEYRSQHPHTLLVVDC